MPDHPAALGTKKGPAGPFTENTMTLQQIHYALVIAETKSMNKAARKLFISQPTLTSAMRELETDLGITIFLRSGRGVTVTNEGSEFLSYAAQIYQMYELTMEKYGDGEKVKRRFCVSTQHYSFAVKAFVETVRAFGTNEYEFSILETRTRDVIRDVSTLRSEIGVLYMNDYNRKVIQKYLTENDLLFHHLICCKAYVYLWKGHPLAGRDSISLADLEPYPCISFEQGDDGSFYFAEEILPDNLYPKLIKSNDRATNLNLMRGLNGYTLCSGIISEELNGDDYIAVPFRDENENLSSDMDILSSDMDIGYITKKQNIISKIGQAYIEELKACLT